MTAPDVHDADDDAPALLLGATAPGALQPVPVVTIDGTDVASGLLAGRPAGLVVVDGLHVSWGRDADQLTEQADPPTGRLSLFDPSGVWATSADLRGKRVELSWTVTPPASGPVRQVFYRGRVGGPVKVRRKVVQLHDGTRIAGTLVDLPLVSILVDLANIRPTIDWPEETVAARRDRLLALAQAAGVLTGGIAVRDYWTAPNVRPVAAKDQLTVWQHLVNLFDSTGADRLTYVPLADALLYVARRDFFQERGLGRLWWDRVGSGTPRAGKGVWVRPYTLRSYSYLDADVVQYEESDGITQPARVTRVELVHPDGQPGPAGGFPDRVVSLTVPGANETRDGVRTVRLESQLTWRNYADTAASDLADLVRKEGAAWRLEPISWSSKRAGGFETLAHVQWMLAGGEQVDGSAPGLIDAMWVGHLVWLQGSWVAELGLRPVFGVMGGTIAYRGGSWELEFALAPITTTLKQHAITWEEIDDGSADYQVEWWDGEHPRGLHSSLTYEDLAHVASGLNATAAIGPDTGWDALQ